MGLPDGLTPADVDALFADTAGPAPQWDTPVVGGDGFVPTLAGTRNPVDDLVASPEGHLVDPDDDPDEPDPWIAGPATASPRVRRRGRPGFAPSWRIVAGTGHRPQHLTPDQAAWARRQAHDQLLWLRDVAGVRVVRSGLALGWDTWLAQAALELDLELWAEIPFEAQPDRWPAADRLEWRRLRDAAARVTVHHPDPTTKAEAATRLHLRNDALVGGLTNVVIALWRSAKTDGGTASAVAKARDAGRPVLHLDPDARTAGVVEDVVDTVSGVRREVRHRLRALRWLTTERDCGCVVPDDVGWHCAAPGCCRNFHNASAAELHQRPLLGAACRAPQDVRDAMTGRLLLRAKLVPGVGEVWAVAW